ncbi:MAG: hypothetical protein H7281_02495 [Bacteriovorax sp.]|nr:hypothetical protein [Bacteriovorax sp.]
MFKTLLMTALILGSTLSFAGEVEVDTTGTVLDSSEVQAVTCPMGSEAVAAYVWSSELHKFVRVGDICRRTGGR